MASSIITSVVTGGSNSHATVSSEANTYATDFVNQGVLGSITSTSGVAPTTGSFGVNQNTGSDMNVKILGTGNTTSTASIAYVTVTPGSQDKQVLRARMTADYTGYAINSNATGSTVYDWIYLQASATNAATPSASADNVITLFTSRSTSSSSDTGSPPTYGTLLAVVTVANGATAITNANISDRRTQVTVSTGSTSSTTGWQTLSQSFTYGANNGNKEFTVTTPNDLTGTLSPGMKMSFARAITPPTQAMSFTAASSQYATKASPSGISFTGAFTCEAWVYLNSYTGTIQVITNREDNAGTTGGWIFRLSSNGQPEIIYGTGSSFTSFQSYQSIPLKQWVHLAGVVTSVGSKTGAIYINGSSVTVSSPLSAATTLTQASVDLRLGAASATPATTYFDGYMSEVRVWSTNRTTQNIQDNMAKSLVGNESNLVALHQGNGVFTDATSNSNNLTANGGAIATQAANPYNATEYAQVLAVSYSNPTSTITLNTGIQNTIPNMTLNSPQYSNTANPFGLPVNLKRYQRYVQLGSNQTTTSTSVVQVPGLAITLTIPSGSITRVRAYTNDLSNTASNNAHLSIWSGTVGSGTQLQDAVASIYTASANVPTISEYIGTQPSSSATLNVGYYGQNAGTTTVTSASTTPAFLLVECDI